MRCVLFFVVSLSMVLLCGCSVVEDTLTMPIESNHVFSGLQTNQIPVEQTPIGQNVYLAVSPATNDLGNAYEFDVVEGQVLVRSMELL